MGFQPFPILGRALRRGLGSTGRAGGGTVYLLKDEFNTPRAAGSVNGTPAEPTGQTRTAVGNDGQLSISGGLLVVPAQTTPVWGDLGLYYATGFARTRGLVLMIDYTQTTLGAGNYPVMWLTAAALNSAYGTGVEKGFSTDAAGLLAIGPIGQAAGGNGTIVSSTLYKFAIILRTAGVWMFIKGGAFTNWTLVWLDVVGSTAMLYAATSNFNSVGSADNIRVPVALYIPQPLAYDTFTRANGALGSTETVGPDGQVLTPIAWGTPTGTWAITANKAGASALAGGLAIATLAVPSKDNFIEAALTRAAGLVGVVGRYIDANNYIYAYHDGANAGIKQRLASVETDIIAATPTAFVASAVMRLIMDGNSCRLFYNNAGVGGAGAINAALNGAVDGLYTTDTGNTFDGVTSWARGTGGEYEAGLNPL